MPSWLPETLPRKNGARNREHGRGSEFNLGSASTNYYSGGPSRIYTGAWFWGQITRESIWITISPNPRGVNSIGKEMNISRGWTDGETTFTRTKKSIFPGICHVKRETGSSGWIWLRQNGNRERGYWNHSTAERKSRSKPIFQDWRMDMTTILNLFCSSSNHKLEFKL